MSKRIVLAAAFFLVALGALALAPRPTSAAQRDIRDFTLYNRSYYTTIVHVYVSPSSSNYWGDDVLGDQVIVPGDYADISFSPYAGFNTCYYDIRIDGDDGSTTYDWNTNLCEVSSVTFHD
jgi:hypothetical protein